MTKKTNWQQTNSEHMYKYTGDKGEDGRHLEGVETSTQTGKSDQGVTVPPLGAPPGVLPG